MGIKCDCEKNVDCYVNIKRIFLSEKNASATAFVYFSKEDRDLDKIPFCVLPFGFVYDLESSKNVYQQAYDEIKNIVSNSEDIL